MSDLVTLEQAKNQIKGNDWTYEDGHLDILLKAAHGVVLEHVNQRISGADEWAVTVAAWTEDTVPENVRLAILLQFAALARFRGDDDKTMTGLDDNGLAIGVAGLLRRLRDPALA